jgi:nitrogenase molybdenum-iron protein alpha chain
MSLLKSKTAIIREKRLQAIAAYYGKPDTLLEEYAEGQLAQRVRTFSQDVPNDILYALQIISTVKNAALVIHGAAGCGVARLSFHLTDEIKGKWAITNLNERDSIMGSESKLREAIKQVHKLHRPEIIFIISSPVVAINNDDIESVVEELKDELNIAIVPVYTDGFRSKIGATGYDIVSHAIIKHILPARKVEKIPNLVNLLSISEKPEDIAEITRLLHEIGLTVNLFPQHASLENIKRLPQASFSIAFNLDEGDYPGVVLEKRFEIPFLQTDIPVGMAHTETWISEIGKYSEQETKVLELIQSEKEKLSAELKKDLSIKQKVFVNLPPALAFGVAELLEELGHEVIGLKLSFLDVHHIQQIEKIKANKSNFSLLVGEGQAFEEENVLRKLQPELYIGKGGDYSTAIRQGIPVINLENLPVAGFKGSLNLSKKIAKTLSNQSFVQLLAGIKTKTYTESWLKKNPNWFIKQEVK